MQSTIKQISGDDSTSLGQFVKRTMRAHVTYSRYNAHLQSPRKHLIIGLKNPCSLDESCFVLPARETDTTLCRVWGVEQQVTVCYSDLLVHIPRRVGKAFQRSRRASLNAVRLQRAAKRLKSVRIQCAEEQA